MSTSIIALFEPRHDKTNKIAVRPAKTPPSLIKVFAVRMKKPWVLSYPLSAQRRLCSDWADAQVNLSLRWTHTHFVMSWLIYHRPLCRSHKRTGLRKVLERGSFGKMSHDTTKPTKWVCVQRRLSEGPVWSESSLCDQWVAKDPSFLQADSEDSDQTGRMPRLMWVFAGRTATLLVLSCRGSNNKGDVQEKLNFTASFQNKSLFVLSIHVNI